MSEQAHVRIRVLVVEDHPIVREAVCAAIDDEDDMVVVGQAADGIAASRRLPASEPDVVVMDLFCPGRAASRPSRRSSRFRPRIRVLALTSSTDETVFLRAQAGATGYLVQDSQRRDLLTRGAPGRAGGSSQSRRMAGPGRAAHYRGLRAGRGADRSRSVRSPAPHGRRGRHNHEIAERLFPASTVRTHIQHLQEKPAPRTATS